MQFINEFKTISQVITYYYDAIKEYLKKWNTRASLYRDEQGILVAKQAHTWQEIKEKIENNNFILGRDVETSRKYRTKMSMILDEWRSIDDYCKHAYLDQPVATSRDESGKVVRYIDEEAINRDSHELTLALNEFPYYVTDDVQHYVLWSTREKKWKEYQDYVVNRFPKDNYDVIIVENSKENKSVKSVIHVHVFVRSKNNENEET